MSSYFPFQEVQACLDILNSFHSWGAKLQKIKRIWNKYFIVNKKNQHLLEHVTQKGNFAPQLAKNKTK